MSTITESPLVFNCAWCNGPASTELCSHCQLVKYCSQPCKDKDSEHHRTACQSPLHESTWIPGWERNNRPPTFQTSPSSAPAAHKNSDHLCGNTPAFDGVTYAGLRGLSTLDLLFAASGDLRNVIAAVNGPQVAAADHVHIVVNDNDYLVVIRNLLILIILGAAADSPDAGAKRELIGSAIHLWYSAFLPPILARTVRAVCSSRLRSILQDTPLSGTGLAVVIVNVRLTAATRVKVAMPPAVWDTLAVILRPEASDEAAYQAAKASRLSVTMAADRVDVRERHLLQIPRQHRYSVQTFWEDGMLLPASATRELCTVPNFTLFHPHTGEWMMSASYSPLKGYFLSYLVGRNNARNPLAGVPSADIFGILYQHLHDTLSEFALRLGGTFPGCPGPAAKAIALTHVCFNAMILGGVLRAVPGAPREFDFIDASNLTDIPTVDTSLAYLGVGKVLLFVGFPLRRPGGVLLSSFMHIMGLIDLFLELSSDSESGTNDFALNSVRVAKTWLPDDVASPLANSASGWKLRDLAVHFREWKKYWDFYMRVQVEHEMAFTPLTLKSHVTPWKLKLGPGRKKEEVLAEASLLSLNGLTIQPHVVLWKYRST